MREPFLEQQPKNFNVDVVAQRLASNPEEMSEYEGCKHINHVGAPQDENYYALINCGKKRKKEHARA